MNNTVPCKACPDRVLHCHSNCERYKKYREGISKSKKAAMARIDEADFIRTLKREVWRRYNKRRKGDDR